MKYSLVIAVLLGALAVEASIVQTNVRILDDELGEDKVKKAQAAPGKSSAETPVEAGESKDDVKTTKQNELIAKIQASGDNASQRFDAMHNVWGGRDKALKAAEAENVKVEEVKKEKKIEQKEKDDVDAETWTSDMPDKYLKPKEEYYLQKH